MFTDQSVNPKRPKLFSKSPLRIVLTPKKVQTSTSNCIKVDLDQFTSLHIASDESEEENEFKDSFDQFTT